MTTFVNKTSNLPKSNEEVARWGMNLDTTEELDDWSSEWQEVLAGNGVWGGRTRGGRGVQKITGRTRDISVDNISLAFCGKELLQSASIKFVHKHRYAIIGENGVGKSTLLRRIAKQSIPGIPLHFRFGYVQQELPVAEDIQVLDYIIRGVKSAAGNAEERLEQLRAEEADLETKMGETVDNEELSELAERLCVLADQIDELEASIAKAKSEGSLPSAPGQKQYTKADLDALGDDVAKIIDGLGLSKPIKRMSMKLSTLSGGWRMRAALAQCLCNIKALDVLLLDEPTNHLDLPTIAWLQDFLAHTDTIVVFVSHDRSFINEVATDMIEMKDLGLHYFPGSYDDFLRNKDEMMARRQNALDAKQRKESHIQKTIEAAHARGDDRLAKTKSKKLERAAFTKSMDGHRFKLFSLAKLDETAIHMPEILEAERERYQSYRFKFPLVDAASLRLPTPSAPLLTMEKCAISYTGRDKAVLENVTLQLTLQSRVGIIGRNGKGKSTLMQALAYADTLGVVRNLPSHGSSSTGPDDAQLDLRSGKIWKHHNLRIGVIAQHQIDILSQHLYDTPVSYISSLMTGTEVEIRTHLGAFGLGGSVALQKVGSLSGGQKARLSFAAVCATKPHLLFLDEPSNHLSMDAIDCLITACQDFTGGIVVVSHNKYLLSHLCNELFVVSNNGTFSVRKPAAVENDLLGKGKGDSDSDEEGANAAFVELLEKCIQEQIKG